MGKNSLSSQRSPLMTYSCSQGHSGMVTPCGSASDRDQSPPAISTYSARTCTRHDTAETCDKRRSHSNGLAKQPRQRLQAARLTHSSVACLDPRDCTVVDENLLDGDIFQDGDTFVSGGLRQHHARVHRVDLSVIWRPESRQDVTGVQDLPAASRAKRVRDGMRRIHCERWQRTGYLSLHSSGEISQHDTPQAWLRSVTRRSCARLQEVCAGGGAMRPGTHRAKAHVEGRAKAGTNRSGLVAMARPPLFFRPDSRPVSFDSWPYNVMP